MSRPRMQHTRRRHWRLKNCYTFQANKTCTQRSQLHPKSRNTCPLHNTRSRPRKACYCRRPPDKLCNWMNSCSPKRRSSFRGRTTRSSSLSRRGPWSSQHTSPLGTPRSPCCSASCRSRGRTKSSLWRPTSQCTTRRDNQRTRSHRLPKSTSPASTLCTHGKYLRRSHCPTGQRCTIHSRWRPQQRRRTRPRKRCTTQTYLSSPRR